MRRNFTLTTVAALAALSVQIGSAQTVYGLSTRNQLVSWNAATPGTLMQSRFISGMAANEAIINIDFRPATGQLYALGSFANLYTLNTSTGAASFVAGLSTAAGPLQLNGVEFGFDFNPTVDRIRIVADQGDNFRANPATGVTIIDGSINFLGGEVDIVGSAYINNDNDPNTGTTLYSIDSVGDRLMIQTPPNAGTQTVVGGLGLNTSGLVGFDVLTVSQMNTAYAAMQTVGDTDSKFYTINLATGAATLIGSIGQSQTNDSLAIRDIAVTPVPEPATLAVLGLGLAALKRRRKSA